MTLLHGFVNTRQQSKELLSVIEWLVAHDGFDVCNSGMNGETVYQIFSSRNGSSDSWETLKEKMSFAIAHETKDSYGVFFVYDQASLSGDNWVVWRLANNKLSIIEDVYLSPYSKVIENSENT